MMDEKIQDMSDKRKLRLLIATDNFLPRWDGIARFLSEIIPRLMDEYEVTVVGPHFGPFMPKGYRLVTIPLGKHGMDDYRLAKFKPKTIKRLVKQADIVFTQTVGPIGVLAVFYARRYKIPVASYMHSIEWELVSFATDNLFYRRILHPLTRMYAKFVYNRSNLMIVPSEGIAESLSWHGIHTKKIPVNLGVNTNVFKPRSMLTEEEIAIVEHLRKELGLEGSFVVGYHGRIAHEKDLLTQMRAFQWLQKKHQNVKLLLIGDGPEEIRKKLRAVKGIIVLPARNNVNYYLNLMDAYITSSLTETTSLTTLEAMSSGLPVVATPVGFIKEYIDDGYNGFLFRQKDAFSLYKKLDLIKTNSSLAATISNRARDTVVRRFSWEKTVEGIKKALSVLE